MTTRSLPPHSSAGDESMQKVCIWTLDKYLAQCVRGDRVVQVDRRGNKILTADGIREKFGVDLPITEIAALFAC